VLSLARKRNVLQAFETYVQTVWKI
jgi:hypothetical protein